MTLNIVTLLVWSVLEFNPRTTTNTHAIYASILIGIMTAALILYRVSPRLAYAVCLINIAYNFVIWVLLVPTSSSGFPRGANWLAFVGLTAAVVGLVCIVRRCQVGAVEPSGQH